MSEIKKYTAQIRDVQFGAGVTVVEPVNLYECEIGNDVFVGPFVEIQKGVEDWRSHTHSKSHLHL